MPGQPLFEPVAAQTQAPAEAQTQPLPSSMPNIPTLPPIQSPALSAAEEAKQKATEAKLREYAGLLSQVRTEVRKVVVDQEAILDSILVGLLANGHILMEGVPGTAKTLLTRAISRACGCEFKRIQFTPDLLPSDLTGITSYSKERGFYVVKGPIFANFVLANGINRTPAKVQSALLESMQERQATIGKETFPMPEPFFVIATQNPVETLGTYPLPEAQTDRFLLKLVLHYPGVDEEIQILDSNTSLYRFEDFELQPVLSPRKIIEMQDFTKELYASPRIEQYIVALVDATRHPTAYRLKHAKYIEFGASPRASIGLYIAAKARAVLDGKAFVTPAHVKAVAHDVLRHRILLNYEGQAEGIRTEDVVTEVVTRVKPPT